MAQLHVAFLIVAALLFLLAAGWPTPPAPATPTRIGWLGMAFLAAAFLT